MLISLAKSQDMQKYLSDTRVLIKNKNYKKALQRCIWFHEHALEYNEGMAGVRLSFALAEWKSLGDVYPAAMDSLISVRDNKTATLISEGKPRRYFGDVCAINHTLAENEKTIDLFETLSKKYPKNIKIYWPYARDVLFAAKRFDIIKQVLGNALKEFSDAVNMYNLNKSLYKDPTISNSQFKVYNKNSFVERSVQLVEFSLFINDKKSAIEIREQAVKMLNDQRLLDALTIK